MANEIMIGDLPVATANPKLAVTRADNSDAQFIQDMGGIAGEAVAGIQGARVRRAVTDVGDALNASRQVIGDIEGGELTAQGIQDLQGGLVSERAKKAFSQINSALLQSGNRRGSAAAKARLLAEKEIRNISALTPGFSDEIRKSAAEVLGFDPTGGTMQELFSMADPAASAAGPTEFDKAKELLGPMYDTPLGDSFYSYMNQYNATAEKTAKIFQETGWFKAASAKATVEFNYKAGETSTKKYTSDWMKANSEMTNFSSLIKSIQSRATVGGQGLSTMDQAQASLELDTLKKSLMEEYTGNLPDNFTLTQDDIAAAEREIDRQLKPTRDLIENADAFSILQENIQTIELLADRGLWENAPELMTINRLSPAVATDVFRLLRLATDNDNLQIQLERNPIIKSLADKEGIDSITKYVRGSIVSQRTGTSNQSPAPTPEAQKAVDLSAANTLIDNGGLKDKSVADRLLEGMPKVTLGKIANKPELLQAVPEESLPTLRAQYLAQMVALTPGATKDLPMGLTGGLESPWLDGTLKFESDLNTGALIVRDKNNNLVTSPALERMNSVFGRIYNSRGKSRLFDTNASFADMTRSVIQLSANAGELQKINKQLLDTANELQQEMNTKSRTDSLKAITSSTLDAESLNSAISTAESGVAGRYKDLKDQRDLIKERHVMLKQEASQFRGMDSVISEMFPEG